MQLSFRLTAPSPRPSPPPSRSVNAAWFDRLFASKAVAHGGVIRRAVADVEREVGRAALELEVRRRGFHLIECGGQFIIVCSGGPIRLVC